MAFTAEQETKIIKFWYESKTQVTGQCQLCHEFKVHARDAPKDNIILLCTAEDTVMAVDGTVDVEVGFSGEPDVTDSAKVALQLVAEPIIHDLTALHILNCQSMPHRYDIREQLELPGYNMQHT